MTTILSKLQEAAALLRQTGAPSDYSAEDLRLVGMAQAIEVAADTLRIIYDAMAGAHVSICKNGPEYSDSLMIESGDTESLASVLQQVAVEASNT